MAFILDPVNILGLAFNIIILVLGFWGYTKSNDKAPLYIGIAFVLFAISYIITLQGLKGNFESALILLRAVAYLILTYAVYKLAIKQ